MQTAAAAAPAMQDTSRADARRRYCRYPAKHRTMMNFLSSILREEGGYEFKKARRSPPRAVLRAPALSFPSVLVLARAFPRSAGAPTPRVCPTSRWSGV